MSNKIHNVYSTPVSTYDIYTGTVSITDDKPNFIVLPSGKKLTYEQLEKVVTKIQELYFPEDLL